MIFLEDNWIILSTMSLVLIINLVHNNSFQRF